MTGFLGVTVVCLLVGSAFAASPSLSLSRWSGPARELGGKVAEITGPGTVALDLGNRSSLSKADTDAVRTALEGELAARGVHLAASEQAAASVVVTLSENLREYVWVAEVQVGKSEKSVVMVAVARAEAGVAPAAASGVVLRKQLLWTQEEAILDVVMLDSQDRNAGSHMAVLDGSKVTLLHLDKGKWQKDQELPLQHEGAWPRDLRGRLVVGRDQLLDVYLPGVFCSTAQRGGVAMECADKEGAWPLEGSGELSAVLDVQRNFFTGTILELTGNVRKYFTGPAFYSVAALPREKYRLWIFAATDGTVHALDGMTDQVWRGMPWGSDIAAVHTGCGSGWQVAASGRADVGNDELKVYDVPDHEPMAMSAGLSFPGKITALWPGSGTDAQAMVVIHNEEASRYEAYRVLFTCGD